MSSPVFDKMPMGSVEEDTDFDSENDYENIEEEQEIDSDTFDDVSEEEDYETDTSIDEVHKKKQKKSRKRRNLGDLILREVEEVSGDEDEEDTLVAEDGFNEMEKLMKQREAYGVYDRRRSSRIDYAIRDADQDQLEELAKRWTRTESRDEFLDEEGDSISQVATTSVHKKRLLPTIKDPSLWMVRCQIGQEANAVLALMRKSLFLKKNGKPIDILSAVYQNGIKGFIYVEAHKQSHVKTALQGLSYFTYGINKQKMVPLAEMPQVLKMVKETVIVEPDSWVRIKRGEYRNDLAQVVSVDKVKNSVIVKLIPRIDYRQINKNLKNDNANKDGEKKFFRAEPALFNIDNIRREGGTLTQDSSGFYVFAGNRYKEGLVYKRFPIKSLIVSGVEPRLNELEKFKAATDDRYSNEFSVTLNRSFSKSISGGSLSKVNESAKSSTTVSFKVGDLVQLVSGELMDSVGHIISIDGDAVQLQLEKHEAGQKPCIIEVLVDDLRKHFAIGDNVAVISGEHQGQVGMVVRVEHPYVIVFSNDSFSEMKVFSHNLHKTTSRFSGVDSMGKFQVGEFIRIDSNTVGCITKIQNDTVEFLNQMGKTNTSKIFSIQKHTPKRGFFRDKLNNPISIGDSVRVVGVDSLRDVVGQIKMLVFEWAFVYSPMIRKERGMFTCKSRNLIVEKNTQSNPNNSMTRSGLMSSGMDSVNIVGAGGYSTSLGSPAMSSPALVMSPRITSGHQPTSSATVGNTSLQYDESNSTRYGFNQQSNFASCSTNIKNLRGKTVRITHGPYKGYYGIVRDCSGQVARIELHANGKTISVNMSEFMHEGDERPLGSMRTPASSINTPYSTGSTSKSTYHTPSHVQGSETPGMNTINSHMYAPSTPRPSDTVSNTPSAYGSTTPSSGFMGSSHDFNVDDIGYRHHHDPSVDTSSTPNSKLNRIYTPLPPDSSASSGTNIGGFSSTNKPVPNLMSLKKDMEVKLTANHPNYPNAIGKVQNKTLSACNVLLKNSNEVINITDVRQLLLVVPARLDQIEVISGEYKGKKGKFISSTGNDCIVEILYPDGQMRNIRLPFSSVAKICTSF